MITLGFYITESSQTAVMRIKDKIYGNWLFKGHGILTDDESIIWQINELGRDANNTLHCDERFEEWFRENYPHDIL